MKKLLCCLLFLCPAAWAESCFNEGMPLDELTQCANGGDAKARGALGKMYLGGQGVPQDYKKAFEWTSKAAAQGIDAAQNNLAVMYENGLGVPKNYKKALELYSKAAEQGLIEAQYNLGVMYFIGEGVPQDYVLSYKWFNLVAKTGDTEAIKNINILMKSMTPEQITKGQQMSADWLAKHPKK